MGVVYRAHDTSLGRDVAIKFLPESFTADPVRLMRFEREARLLASLSHPNIAAIYGLEELKGTPFLMSRGVVSEGTIRRSARSSKSRFSIGARDFQNVHGTL